MAALSPICAGLVAVAPPAVADHNTCGSGHVLPASWSGSVSPTDEDWFLHSSAGPTAIWMTPTAGDPDMKIMDQNCTTVVCYPFVGGTETCSLPAGTYNIGVLYFGGSNSTAYYSLANNPQCGDNVDNDADGSTDYPADYGCTSKTDATESPNPQCADGLDNDADGRTDYPNDYGCTGYFDATESPNPQCSDGIDNDADGRTDHPADSGCGGPTDNSEGVACTTSSGIVVCAGISPGPETPMRVTVYTPGTDPGPDHRVAGYVDLYRFVLPNGTTVSLPCVGLVADTVTVNPCVGRGEYVQRLLTLVDEDVNQPDPDIEDQEVASVRICEAELVVTVNGIGIPSSPAYTLCN